MSILGKLRFFFTTKYYFAAMLLMLCVISFFGLEVQGTVFFVLLIALQLVLCDDILATTLPFMLLSLSVIKCYNSFDVFIGLWWLAIPLIAALIFRIFKYSSKIRLDKSFWGLIAVALAVTLGGAGTISKEEYLNPVALYYVIALGFGMVLAYLYLASQLPCKRDYKISRYFSCIMYTVAIAGTLMVLENILINLPEILSKNELPSIQWSNNVSTFLIIAMPFVFYFEKRRWLHLSVATLVLISIILTCSRGGLLMGSVTYFICSVSGIITDKKNRLLNSLFFAAAIASILLGFYCFKDVFMKQFMYNKVLGEYSFISKNEQRMRLWERMKTDFASNKLFGRGLGYAGNADIYNPKPFAMYWYHSAPMQILGSLGLFGLAMYIIQIATRVAVVLQNLNMFRLTIITSFTGLWLMSLVNPGIFCPIPYEFIAMLMFALVEYMNHVRKHKPTAVVTIPENSC